MEETKPDDVFYNVTETKQEIVASTPTEVVVESTTNDIAKYNFERVNINDPKSIVTYGNKTQSEISSFLESAVTMSAGQQRNYLSDDDLKKIVGFNEALEEAKRQQEAKVGLLERWGKKFRKAVGDKSVTKEEEMKTYVGRFNDYRNNLNHVSDNLKLMGSDALADIEFRSEIAIQIAPYLEKLECMIETGKEDKEAYDAETLKMGNIENPEVVAAVTRRTQLSNAFAVQINGMSSALAVYKGKVQDLLLQQNSSMIIVQTCNDFLTKQKSVLELQAVSQLTNLSAKEQLAQLTDLTEAINLAIQKGTESTLESTEMASNLALNSGFWIETIEKMADSINEGVAIIKDTKMKLAAKTQEEQAALDTINAELDANKQEILDIIQASSTAVGTVSGDNKPTGRRLSTRNTSPRFGK